MDDLSAALNSVRSRTGGLSPRIALVLGSGLGGLADLLEDARHIPYHRIAAFTATTVAGHQGELVVGELEGTAVVVQNGRFHLYEGHDPSAVVLPVRLFAELGVTYLFVTNAAGGLSSRLRPPVLMLIAGHVNFMWRNPLIGKRLPCESRWPDLANLYDKDLRAVAGAVALDRGIPLVEGVYAGVLGPAFETPAEVRMLRRLGCDAVGMSTVPEAIAARARGLRVLGISTITNQAAGLSTGPLSHAEVLHAGQELVGNLGELMRGIVRRVGHTG